MSNKSDFYKYKSLKTARFSTITPNSTLLTPNFIRKGGYYKKIS